jgi:hypothetical protein
VKQSHTPGPWRYGPATNYEGFYIAPQATLPTLAAVQVGCLLSDGSRSHVNNITCFNFPGDTEANARLIAAAPELLEMARRYASECAQCDGTGLFRNFNPRREAPQEHGEDCKECRTIRDLIAKAGG